MGGLLVRGSRDGLESWKCIRTDASLCEALGSARAGTSYCTTPASRIGVTLHGRIRVHAQAAPGTASLATGQLIQRGPPRPRPSSLPGIVITSMPRLRRKVFVVTLRS